MAVTSNQPDFIPLLINGRPLKSLNQFYNQRRAKLQSLLKGNRQSSQRIRRLTRSRNQKVDDYLHKATGKRISRGLYRTDRGFLCQSDVMGSYNILRKAFPNAFNRYGIERCVVHPRRINLSK